MHVNWFYLFGIPFGIALLFMPVLFSYVEKWQDRKRWLRLPRVCRIGFVRGRHRQAVCSKCRGYAKLTRQLYRNEKGFHVPYTEFICPACLPAPKGK